MEEGYTRDKLLYLCNGDIEFMENMFFILDWQYPETYINEYEDSFYADKQ